MMKSIMRVKVDSDIDKVIEKIENTSKVKVLGYTKAMGFYSITLQHSDAPTCPKCGKEIHAYGHGLCLSCWNELKNDIGAKS